MVKRRVSGVTIRAVAEHAGVSAMTVSNVINGTGRVSEATAEAVRLAIDRLGYLPNVSARRLAGSRATMIGVMYNDQRTPFLEAILVGALRATNAHGIQLVLQEEDTSDRRLVEEAAVGLVRSGADALLLVPPFAEMMTGGLLATLGVPAAAIATGHALPDISTVRIDNRSAMADIVRHLVAHGHRRIGFVGGPDAHSDSAERLMGYEAAMRAEGLTLDPALRTAGWFDYESGVAAADYFLALAVPPSAVICANDDMAAGLIGQALNRGVRLPQDLAVTGFDDTLTASRIWPPLTTVRQPVELLAFAAIEQVIAALTPDTPLQVRDSVVPHTLVVRQSVAPFAPPPLRSVAARLDMDVRHSPQDGTGR